MNILGSAANSGSFGQSSFEALLEEFLPAAPRQFGTVSGIVTGEDKNGFRVEHGGKSEGFIPRNEAGELAVGDTVECVVIGTALAHSGGRPGEFDETAVALSHKRVQTATKIADFKTKATAVKAAWNKGLLPSEAAVKDTVVYATVLGVNKNKMKRDAGLDVRLSGAGIEGIVGFVPGDEVNQRLPGMSRFRDFVGKTIPLVVEVPQKGFGDRSKPVFSHSKAVDLLTCVFLQGLRPGSAVSAVVVRHSFFDDGAIKGAVLAVNDGLVTGFVPNPLVSYSRAIGTAEALPIGKEVQANVDEVNAGKLNLKLSTRRATIDWDKVRATKGEQSGVVDHIVEREDRSGGNKIHIQLLVKLDNGVIAEVFPQDVTPRSRTPIGDRCPVGTRVTGLVYGNESSNGRVKLSLSPMTDPIFARLTESKGKVVEGIVHSKKDLHGYFISFDNNDGVYLVDGLLHNARLKRVNGADESFEVGQKVNVRVEKVIAADKVVSLTRKDVED